MRTLSRYWEDEAISMIPILNNFPKVLTMNIPYYSGYTTQLTPAKKNTKKINDYGVAAASCVQGSEILAGGVTTWGAFSASVISCCKCLSLATLSECYNTIGIQVNDATPTGNLRLACYDTVGGVPTNLLSESDSIAITNGWNDLSVPEFSVPTVQLYIAFQIDTSNIIYFIAGAAGDRYTKGQAYGVFPDPLAGTSSNSPASMRLKYV